MHSCSCCNPSSSHCFAAPHTVSDLCFPLLYCMLQVVGDLMDRLCVGGKDGAAAAEEIALMVLGSGMNSWLLPC
jgi:hypothetical protein